MPTGPGKYGAVCTKVREETQAKAAIVIVLNGVSGTGFSVQSHGQDITHLLPALLRQVADQIYTSLHQTGEKP